MDTTRQGGKETILHRGHNSSTNLQAYLVLFLCVSVSLPLAALILMGYFSRKNCFPLDKKTAIVTGGSQGLGLSAAKQLASKGANVVIVAQDVPKLEAALHEIKQSAQNSAQRFLCLSFDLRSPASAPEILSEVTKWNDDIPPSIVWCCAGNCIPGFFADTAIDTLRGQMDTVYWSAAYTAHATLNHWLSSPPPPATTSKLPQSPPPGDETRHLIFTSSSVAFFPIAGYAPYTPAKAAMKSLSDTLIQEVAMHNAQYNNKNKNQPTDIKIHTLFPMGILTPGYANEQALKPALTHLLEKDDRPQTPDDVARIAIAALERGDYLITTMWLGHLLRGVGMGASVRNGLADLFWSLLGAVAVWFVVPDFVHRCRRWGGENADEARTGKLK